MCGIVGLFAKRPDVEERLGALLGDMLGQMADRGPDSAGLAVYRDPAPAGSTKLSLHSEDPGEDWSVLGAGVAVHASHAVVVLDGEADDVLHMPEESLWPFVLALTLSVLFAGLLLDLPLVATAGGVMALGALAGWHLPRAEDEDEAW